MEKLHFAFRMYDIDGDDKISKVGKSSEQTANPFSMENIKQVALKEHFQYDIF